MFRHEMCHPQEVSFVTLLNYIDKIVSLAKINKVFKILKVSNVIKQLLLHEVCMVAVCTVCVLVYLLCLPGTF